MINTIRKCRHIAGIMSFLGAVGSGEGAEQFHLLVVGDAEYLGVAQPTKEQAEIFLTCDGEEIPIIGEIRNTQERCEENTGIWIVLWSQGIRTDMAEIYQALETADLSEEERQQVMDLLAEGERLHRQGQHEQSIAVVAQAKEILGIE